MTSSAATGLLRSRWERLTGAERIAGIDLARGLAVVGMLAAHLADIPDPVWGEPDTWGGLVHGRSSILFATLAGVSLGIVSGGSRPFAGARLRTVRMRLVVRAALLWVIGLLLVATGVPVLVILPAYAVLFLLALPLLRVPAPGLVALAVVWGLVSPFVFVEIETSPLGQVLASTPLGVVVGWDYPFVVWLTFVVAGLAVARSGALAGPGAVRLLLIGVGLAVVGYGLAELPAPAPFLEAVWTASAHSSGLLEVIGSGGVALAVLGASLLVCRTPVQWVVVPLRAVGAMPLTAYVGQLVVWAALAGIWLGDPGDLVGFRALAPLGGFVAGTVVFCTAWALLVGRGPLEWAVDRVARLAVRS